MYPRSVADSKCMRICFRLAAQCYATCLRTPTYSIGSSSTTCTPSRSRTFTTVITSATAASDYSSRYLDTANLNISDYSDFLFMDNAPHTHTHKSNG